jgi:dienelactone hydrolase
LVRPLAFALLLLAALPARAEEVELSLPTGGAIKADLATPASAKGKSPAIVYLHGAYVRRLGADRAAEGGYDVGDFTRAFADAGFVAIAPIRETESTGDNGDAVIEEGLASVLSALDYLRSRKDVDARRIALVGFEEVATIALWALARMPDIAAAVAMSPSAMTGCAEAETMTLDRFIGGDAIKAVCAPVLVTVGREEGRGARRRTDELTQKLMRSYKRFRYIHTYRGDSRWFRQPRDAVMADILNFLGERLR